MSTDTLQTMALIFLAIATLFQSAAIKNLTRALNLHQTLIERLMQWRKL